MQSSRPGEYPRSVKRAAASAWCWASWRSTWVTPDERVFCGSYADMTSSSCTSPRPDRKARVSACNTAQRLAIWSTFPAADHGALGLSCQRPSQRCSAEIMWSRVSSRLGAVPEALAASSGGTVRARRRSLSISYSAWSSHSFWTAWMPRRTCATIAAHLDGAGIARAATHFGGDAAECGGNPRGSDDRGNSTARTP